MSPQPLQGRHMHCMSAVILSAGGASPPQSKDLLLFLAVEAVVPEGGSVGGPPVLVVPAFGASPTIVKRRQLCATREDKTITIGYDFP